MPKFDSIFVSHSKDDSNKKFFEQLLYELDIKASWLEYEDIPPPAALHIVHKINLSDALFVLLSNYLLERPWTNNWVSFEMGVASNCIKKETYAVGDYDKPINHIQHALPIFVFNPKDMPVSYPVPYCTYYRLYENSETEHRELKQIIKDIKKSKTVGFFFTCEHCVTSYIILDDYQDFYCPICNKHINR